MARAARQSAAKSRGGRPTKSAAIQRDLRLIEVATRLFLERGFEATSIDAVAETARVSKPTVYARYRDKRGLFEAVLRREIARWLSPLSTAAEMQCSDVSGVSVEQVLLDLARQMLDLISGPEPGALGRIVAAQATNFPELARLAEEEGYLKAVSTMTRLFDRLVAERAVQIEDTTIAAEVYLNITVGHTFRQATNGIPIDRKAEEKRLRASLRLLMTGIGGPGGRPQKSGARTRPPR
ncbi:TetR/AcrR family transcriptional regulator [Bradyrhizobium sp. Leo121]|uniref:TetR/AcrR family transcriptional regulator n=1 Tax=Bradyrhizobium sp. Leo121 TaxID=1571195 RepID=UPI00102897E1|nr:TetR/AcrR family transcriptional regulator [Bradyrhizobium sp. Leo121]RZN30566.1 TetR family transcriptional regulator [Bradyrhizobium sp. Leo121]